MKKVLVLILLLAGINASAETVTYVVNGRNSVRSEGVEPAGSQFALYETATTGRVGQLTTGNYALFSLTGLPHIVITDITVHMHSNSSSGSGELRITLNDEVLMSISDQPFSSQLWYGSFSSANVPVDVVRGMHIVAKDGDSLAVKISATENSLYLASISIAYHTANTQPYTVTFNTGTRRLSPVIREETPNSGISLPRWTEPLHDYVFVGWMNEPLAYSDTCPCYYKAGDTYYPVSDEILYALYADSASVGYQWKQTVEFTTGDYLFADTYKHCIAVGGLNKDKKIDTYVLPPWIITTDSLRALYEFAYPEQAVYHIEFLPDSTALITNISDNEVIGFSSSSSGLNLTRNTEPWNYTVYPDYQICFYHTYSPSVTRYLRADEGTTLSTIDILTFAAQSFIYRGYATLLFSISDSPASQSHAYTSYPLTTAVDDFKDNIAVTESLILNPEHCLIQIYSLSGAQVCSSMSDIPLSCLPSGINILRYGMKVKKIFVQ